jgi:hypothetical protein
MKDLPAIRCFKILAVCAFLAIAVTGSANSISITFNNPTGDLGVPSKSYSDGGVTVTAYGYGVGASPHNLFGKNDGGDEVGIGLTGQTNNEINPFHFIQLDISQLLANGFNTAQLFVGSTQGTDEPWDLFVSNTLGTLGLQVITGATADYPNGIDISAYLGYQYISVSANPSGIGGQNVLLSAITANGPGNVPDSGTTVALLSIGLGFMLACRWRIGGRASVSSLRS